MTPERWREIRAAFDRLAPLSQAERDSHLAALEVAGAELAREGATVAALEEAARRLGLVEVVHGERAAK